MLAFRVMEAVVDGGLSRNAAAKRFEMSIALGEALRDPGEISPAPSGGDRAPTFRGNAGTGSPGKPPRALETCFQRRECALPLIRRAKTDAAGEGDVCAPRFRAAIARRSCSSPASVFHRFLSFHAGGDARRARTQHGRAFDARVHRQAGRRRKAQLRASRRQALARGARRAREGAAPRLSRR